MIPEVEAYLDKAQESLEEARKIVEIGLAKAAARSAYYAAFHATEALILARTGKIAKTHSGVRTEFARLSRDLPILNRALTVYLAQAYKFKELGDYGLGASAAISIEDAETLIAGARDFIDRISEALA